MNIISDIDIDDMVIKVLKLGEHYPDLIRITNDYTNILEIVKSVFEEEYRAANIILSNLRVVMVRPTNFKEGDIGALELIGSKHIKIVRRDRLVESGGLLWFLASLNRYLN